MTGELVLFYALAALAVLSAAAVVVARNVVHAVLFMAGNFLITAVLYVLLHAPFMAAVQVIVYAGAIMVLFLFVVMLMGPGRLTLDEPLGGHRGLSLALLAVLGTGLIAAVGTGTAAEGVAFGAAPGSFGSPGHVGLSLFTDHLLAFEVVSVLLLVAVIGAVVIGQFRGDET